MTDILPHWLTKQATLAPEKKAIELESGKHVTFLELKKKSEDLAYRLAGIGVKPASKVAILSNNNIDMAITLHALSYLQAVAVLLNTKLTDMEIEAQLEDAKIGWLITSEDIKKEKAIHMVTSLTFDELKNSPKKQVALMEHIDLSKPYTLMFTSGTTGKPKMVVHTYGNHWWSAIGSTLNLGLHENDKWLLTLPMYHVGGLSILMRSVITGMEVFLMEKYDGEKFFKALQDRHVTIASIVTVMLKDLLVRLENNALPKQVRCLLLGGGAVPEPLLNRVKEKSLPLFQSYGMTETSSQIVTLSEKDALTKIGSSGKALFPAQLTIMNPDEKGIGEIILQGPMVFNGYENNTEANETAFINGWFKTGDLGYIDNDGFLFVMERRTDLIISGGENIYPREIENVLLEMEGIEEAVIVGREDEKWGQVPVAFVVSSAKEIAENKIIDFLKLKIAAYKLPKAVHFVKEIPKNATNKIMRHKLKALL